MRIAPKRPVPGPDTEHLPPTSTSSPSSFTSPSSSSSHTAPTAEQQARRGDTYTGEAQGRPSGKRAKGSNLRPITGQGTLPFSSSSPTPVPNLFTQHVARTAPTPSQLRPPLLAADSGCGCGLSQPDPAQENVKLHALVTKLMQQIAQLQVEVKELRESSSSASQHTPPLVVVTPAAPVSPAVPEAMVSPPSAPSQPAGIPAPPPAGPLAGAAPTTTAPAAAGSKPKRAPVLRHRTVEANETLLRNASLPSVSETDLIISVKYAPHSLGFMKRRVFFPNHVTSSKDTCIAVGKALQDPASLHVAPPRIPSFLMTANGLTSGNLTPLMDTLQSTSKEYLYLQAWKQAIECGLVRSPVPPVP